MELGNGRVYGCGLGDVFRGGLMLGGILMGREYVS